MLANALRVELPLRRGEMLQEGPASMVKLFGLWPQAFSLFQVKGLDLMGQDNCSFDSVREVCCDCLEVLHRTMACASLLRYAIPASC